MPAILAELSGCTPGGGEEAAMGCGCDSGCEGVMEPARADVVPLPAGTEPSEPTDAIVRQARANDPTRKWR